MQLANIVLKVDPIGSSIPLKHVTPAEVMFLVADFHQKAGGDPIVKFQTVADDAEKSTIEKLQKELKTLEDGFEALDTLELQDEIREKRTNSFQSRIQQKRDKIEELSNLVTLRVIPPKAERDRLITKYGAKRIGKFFPGAIPSLPQTFEEARSAGFGATLPVERLVTVGDE